MNYIFQSRIFEHKAKKRLYIVTLLMIGIYIVSTYGAINMSFEEKQALNKVNAMQASLWTWLNSTPVREQAALWAEKSGWEDVAPSQVDHRMSGLIGVEWSEITTTLGPLPLKQISTDPMWAVHILRWFDEAGLVRGDRVMIFASGSFPGFLVSALSASEIRGLKVELRVSLGASTWGANRMEAPWPLLELRLRQAGHLQTQSRYYTPGGEDETGKNYSPEAMTVLEEASAAGGVPLLIPRDLDEIVRMKTEEIRAFGPKLLILIGGSASVMGGSDDILPAGLLMRPLDERGQGVAKEAIEDGIPILHLLNVRELSRQVNKNSNSSVRFWQAAGLLCFFAAL
ncbi:MAG: poly-gamma-glutamate system protein, partial [Synergistaceae bacterium]|nr:poly-gamma-glutamate system protein [Synergistaceae bacterium]